MGGTTSKPAAAEDSFKKKDPSKSSSDSQFTSLPPREKLPADLQKIVDDEDTLFEQIYDGNANPSTDSNLRYAAYAARARTILLSAHRYVAYTSDIGESFRPVAHPWLVRGAYGISWAYLIGDVSHEGYKAYLRQRKLGNPSFSGVAAGSATDATMGSNGTRDLSVSTKVPLIEDWRTVMVQRAVFQSLASMGLPAFTIHSIVKYSGRALKNNKNTMVRTYGPIGLGLAAVPFLPYMFDEPVENAVEWCFHTAFKTLGGPEAVGHSPTTGREDELKLDRRKSTKEKEL